MQSRKWHLCPIVDAREEVDNVDVVVLPESAVDENEVEYLEGLEQLAVRLTPGVRQRSPQPRGNRPG
jgi:hypothetical protein